MLMDKLTKQWAAQLEQANRQQTPINICAGNTKQFYGGEPTGEPLDVRDNSGILNYDPAELVIVARAGTPIAEIESALAENQQMLGFEPPFSAQGATLGGAIATGLAGAGRAHLGGARDFILGCKIINGKGEILQFGGQVMKNVAGFDLFRPMAGAMGTLGLILEVSLRLIPLPEEQISLSFACPEQNDALSLMAKLGKSLCSLTASAWDHGEILLRLSGNLQGIERDQALLAAYSPNPAPATFWENCSEFERPILTGSGNPQTFIIDVPPTSPPIDLPGKQLLIWGGARRYLVGSSQLDEVRAKAQAMNGHVTQLKGDNRADFFSPLTPSLWKLHQQIKHAFDPAGILNPGRLYSELSMKT